jgi:sec-independent protein translocase protein TatA
MGNLGPTELFLVLLVLVLLFGAKKLPELARGSGRALRIFKAETKGLDDEDTWTPDARTPVDDVLGEDVTYAPNRVIEAERSHNS